MTVIAGMVLHSLTSRRVETPAAYDVKETETSV